MPKSTTMYVCQECGASSPKWGGKCGACGAWDTLVEERAEQVTSKGLKPKSGKSLNFINLSDKVADAPRFSMGIDEFDRVLGGGLVEGSATLVGGDPGIGKSTLLLQALVALGRQGKGCVYITGEESTAQVMLRAQRLGLKDTAVALTTSTSVRDILTSLDSGTPPDAVVIDSIQTMFVDTLDSAPGTIAQVRASSHELIRLAKRRGIAMFLVGHVTKDGQIAGPRVMEHMVDTVLYFEGERGHPYRIIRAVKNRFGGTDEIGVFEMTDKGLAEVTNPSALFLSGHDDPVSGASVFAGVEGSRPFLVEVQALVASSPLATPRRAVVGWDANRLAMVVAVLEARCGVRLSDKEIYLNVAGGFKITEPAADLAVAAAILSALTDTPVPANTVFFGEIGLSGEVRAVGRSDVRLKESAKLGFERAVLSASTKASVDGKTLKHLRELVDMFKECSDQTERQYA